MKLKTYFAILALVGIFWLPIDVLACACCAESGQYNVWNGVPSEYQLEILAKIGFAEQGNLFLDAAGIDSLVGLDSLNTKSNQTDFWKFNISDSFDAKLWKIEFKAGNGQTGTFHLPMPTKMTSFMVDVHDGDTESSDPLLYKEWRFKGNVQSGNGFFKSGIVKPTSYFLVFQGRGNNCDNVEDFTHWRLEISGKKAKYAFFGTLDSGENRLDDEN